MMSDEFFSLSLDKIGSFSSTPMVQTKGFPYVFQAQGRHRVFRHVDFPILAWLVVGIVTKLPGLQHVCVCLKMRDGRPESVPCEMMINQGILWEGPLFNTKLSKG